ncbi:ribonuclease E inhibitor RraB [Chitinimonas lacunae]|uniref:Ribonuclease E inhibitor RraB n=1 Tax=Chitinimonas lacunae TaxID=1963018 RepID=A0ABV8MPI5_9NEIS
MNTERNLKDFPANDNGDVLWRMFCSGDNLAKPREIEFFLTFPEESAALDCARLLLQSRHRISLAPHHGKWQLAIYPYMQPTHENITNFEVFLESSAAPLGGENDGWECFEQS